MMLWPPNSIRTKLIQNSNHRVPDGLPQFARVPKFTTARATDVYVMRRESVDVSVKMCRGAFRAPEIARSVGYVRKSALSHECSHPHRIERDTINIHACKSVVEKQFSTVFA